MRTVIIGGSFAGLSCALEARRRYPEMEVIVLESQQHVGFIPSGVNLMLNEQIDRLEAASFISEKEVRSAGVQLYLGRTATAIDFTEQTVNYTDGLSENVLHYDRLVLAMGSVQTNRLVENIQDHRILSTKQYQLAEDALEILQEAQSIVVIGGGQIGIEACEALVNANKQVSLIETQPMIASRYFDEEFVQEIQEAIEIVGVDLRLGESVETITTDPLCVATAQDEFYPEAIIMGVNLIPRTELVAKDFVLAEDGTIPVDDYLRTDKENVWAIGDCVQTNFLQADQRFISLVNNAIRSGQVAASNLLKPTVKRPTSVRIMGARVFSQYITSAGLTEHEARQEHSVHTVTITRPFSLTDATPVHLKLVVNKETGQVLGTQMRSESDILHYGDLLALIVQNGLTDTDLAFQDRLYYPSKTTAYPIIYQAALISQAERG